MRLNAQASKEAKALYIENRIQETDDLNKDLSIKIDELRNILERTLQIDDSISFDDLRIKESFPKFTLPDEFQKTPIITSKEEYFSKISKPTTLEKLVPGWEKRYQVRMQEAIGRYEEYEAKFDVFLLEREKKISTQPKISKNEMKM